MTALPARIPVRVAREAPAAAPGVAVVAVPAPLHAHGTGEACPACAAHGDVRVLLHDLLVQAERGKIAPFSAVVVVAEDVEAALSRLLPGREPAAALRDHVVARRFYLAP